MPDLSWIRNIDVPRPAKAREDNGRFAARGVFSMRPDAGIGPGSARLVQAVATFQDEAQGLSGRVDGALGPVTAAQIARTPNHPINELVSVGGARQSTPSGDDTPVVPDEDAPAPVGVVTSRKPRTLKPAMIVGGVLLVLAAGVATYQTVKPKKKRRKRRRR